MTNEQAPPKKKRLPKRYDKVGRPADENSKIEKQVLEDLAKLYLSANEIKSWFRLNSVETLVRYIDKEYGCNFVEFRERFFVKTRTSIKRKQISKALDEGDSRMLRWVGIQYLGQKERQEVESTVEQTVKVVLTLPENGSEVK